MGSLSDALPEGPARPSCRGPLLLSLSGVPQSSSTERASEPTPRLWRSPLAIVPSVAFHHSSRVSPAGLQLRWGSALPCPALGSLCPSALSLSLQARPPGREGPGLGRPLGAQSTLDACLRWPRAVCAGHAVLPCRVPHGWQVLALRTPVVIFLILFQGEEKLKTSICTFLSVLSHLDIIIQNIPEKVSLYYL